MSKSSKSPSPSSVSTTSIPEFESNLPPNTPETPQATVFKVTNEILSEHKLFVQKLLFESGVKIRSRQNQQLELKVPIIRKFNSEIIEGKEHYSETDFKGETKITENGVLTNGKKFLINTFTLPGRGKELFASGTEVSKFLNCRDAFILYTRYKQLKRQIANEEERKFIDNSSLGLSKLKSRSISYTSVKNLYMVLGAKIVANGLRVVDDYWEDDLIAQGFTEKDQVSPVAVSRRLLSTDSTKTHQISKPSQPSIINKSLYPKHILVTPLPLKEDRLEYIKNASKGETTQVLPGQGITGGLELASIATIPQYRDDPQQQSYRKSLLNQLSTNNSTPNITLSVGSTHLPIDKSLKGLKSSIGLPYYSPSVSNRLKLENSENLTKIEYLHGMVETNTIISNSRNFKNKQWKTYWQSKSGTEIGLTKDKVEEFFQKKKEFLETFEEEVVFNEYLNCEQVITKKKRPNPNHLGYSNIKGLKPSYAKRVKSETPIQSQPEPQPVQQQSQVPPTPNQNHSSVKPSPQQLLPGQSPAFNGSNHTTPHQHLPPGILPNQRYIPQQNPNVVHQQR
ncbi:hypothetical protein WICMUC_005543 [Wickerhamomyces mucosus]|uniref:Uncharacterized protein n=1 Tax=Wickerhamomyces mucosus TaxID=1378264 RepID=A0A9P8T691_9ASCO|nr:hypothetical protein WICMUC_005543 [Wickerhamomyces mucosus]